mmetsp:Transcript_18127/g.33205  ORF Transcript_18127/g.33205 Transcript_18127/m.33205 type:complete len:315 (-) Transcript_18127:182-1126(-)
MTAASSSLDERYAAIKAAQPSQTVNYAAWVSSIDGASLVAAAASLGLELDLASGHISYAAGGSPLPTPALCFDLMYVRHGKTTGNTEPRVYQGYVDEPSNALNEVGLGQAEEAADKLDALELKPDLVILSPLSRAKDTGTAFLKRHSELEAVTEVWDSSHEMAFGDWDNAMVKDLTDDSIAHLFYLDQNAVVKSSEPYEPPAGSKDESAAKRQKPVPVENFVEVLVRMRKVLDDVNARVEKLVAERAAASEGPAAEPTKRPLVLMYGHSMAGAAVGVLTGNGKVVDGEKFLGFDGKYILPNATPVFLHRVGASP